MQKPIYLDYMATTPMDERVIQTMLTCLTLEGDFANPDSNTHILGTNAKKRVENAKSNVAQLIKAKDHEIIWTSGATEANNLAIKGAAFSYKHKGRHIVTCKTEHKSVLDSCAYLEKQGFSVTYLPVQSNGLIDLEVLKKALTEDTILVSIMLVNNEIGVIQDVAAIAKLTREKGILFHVDAVQAAGKITIDLEKWPIDLMSLSAHKVYGPKGVGALYIRSQPRVRLQPQLHGGGQQNGLRAGTLPVHQIVGMGEAFRIAHEELKQNIVHLQQCRDRFWQGLSDLEAISLNGDSQQRVLSNLNICFKHVDAESLMMELSNLAVSNGSACNSIVTESSYVLRALGLSEVDAFSSIRFSFGRFTTLEEIDMAVVLIKKAVAKLRALSPLWKSEDKETLDESEGSVFTAFVESTTLGKAIRLQIKLNCQRMIVEAQFKAQGCPTTMAVANFLCEQMLNKPVEALQEINSQWIATALALPKDKVYCALLGEDAIKTLVRTML